MQHACPAFKQSSKAVRNYLRSKKWPDIPLPELQCPALRLEEPRVTCGLVYACSADHKDFACTPIFSGRGSCLTNKFLGHKSI